MSPQYSNLAIEILNNKSLEAIEYIDDLKMDSGLECGLLSVAHHFNHIYQFSKDIKFKNVACLCYSKTITKIRNSRCRKNLADCFKRHMVST